MGLVKGSGWQERGWEMKQRGDSQMVQGLTILQTHQPHSPLVASHIPTWLFFDYFKPSLKFNLSAISSLTILVNIQ